MPVKTSQVCVVVATAPGGGQDGPLVDLLRNLRAAQVEVTVLDASIALRPAVAPSPSPEAWATICRTVGAIHVVLPEDVRPLPLAPLANPVPYLVYDWLRTRAFTLVIGELTGGLLYFALAARRTGVNGLTTTYGIQVGGATVLDLEQRGALPDDPVLLQRDHLEQQCVAWADGLLGGTAAQHDWMQQRGWPCAPRLNAWTELQLPHPVPDGEAPLPHITVALVHYERPALLRQAVQSLVEQQYADFDVLLVDDGSHSPEALACLSALEPEFTRRGWRIVRQANAYLGAARNRALQEARGEYVLFMDDDNVARPEELAVLARAASRTGADVLTCFFDAFEGEALPAGADDIRFRYLPTGGSLACGVFSNCFGDANALVRREAVLSVGGYSEAREVGTQDYALYAKLLLAGKRLEVVPEALFFYRVSGAGMRLATSEFRNHKLALEVYQAVVPPALVPLLDFGAGAARRILAEDHALRVMQGERDEWRARAQSMEASWSWRLTRGLRWLHRRLGG